MYPKVLENDPKHYWFGEEFWEQGNLVHAYMHKDYRVKMHAHQFYEINIVMKGEGRHYIAESCLPAVVGDIFVIPPQIPHGYFPRQPMDVFHILLSSAFIDRYREELAQIPGYDLLFDIEPLIRRFSGTNFNLNMDATRLAELEKELRKMLDAEAAGLYLYQNVLALGIIERLGTQFQKMRTSGQLVTGEDEEILRILEYIKTNLGTKLTISQIAAFGNMSAATLNRRFHQLFRISPMQYVMDCRVALARELLASHRYTKTEIALQCGFYDTAHMKKALKNAEFSE